MSSNNSTGGQLKGSGTTFGDINDLHAPSFNILILKDFPSTASFSQVYEMFLVDSFSYGNEFTNTEGALVHYTEGIKAWSSDYYTGEQNGSNFRIIERGPYNGDSAMFTIKGIFNCKLYDILGDERIIQSGVFSGQVAPFL